MNPARLIGLGALILALALLLVSTGAALRGSFNPSCERMVCGNAVAATLQWSALPVSIVGALFVGMGLARREPPPENVQEQFPPSRPR